MSDLTVETIKTPEGYDFIRSDGRCFYLVSHEDGQASLYAGRRGIPPREDIVGFDISVADKLARARQWVLAFPTYPGP